jgi:hypothetical protein
METSRVLYHFRIDHTIDYPPAFRLTDDIVPTENPKATYPGNYEHSQEND